MTAPTDDFSEAIPLPADLPGFRPFVSNRTTLALFAGLVAVTVLACLFSGIDPTEGLIAATVLAAPFLLLSIFSRARQDAASAFPRSVCCFHGVLIDRSSESRFSIPLRRCAWFVGWTTDDSRLEPAGVRRRCLVIVLPTGCMTISDHPSDRRNDRWVACGLTPETDVRWREAFDRYGCKRVWRGRGLPGFLLFATQLLLAWVAIALAARLGRVFAAHLLGPLGIPIPEWVIICSLIGLIVPAVFLLPDLLTPWSLPGNRARKSLRRAVVAGPFLMLFMALPSITEWIPSLLWTATVALAGFGSTHFLPATGDSPTEEAESPGKSEPSEVSAMAENPADEPSSMALLSLEGLTVGDAFGQQFFFPELFGKGVSRRQLPVAKWKYTDDTVMAISVTEQLLTGGAIDQDALAKAFTRRFYEDPVRGYGSGMQDLLRRLDDGIPWRTAAAELFGSGSYGNGAAMRVAPVGAYFAHDLERAVHEARLSAEVTHAHPEGISGAIAVAAAGVWAARRRSEREDGNAGVGLLPFVIAVTPPGAVRDGLERAAALGADTWEHDAANQLGNGAKITAADTVPFCLWCAATHHDNYEEALWTVVQVGGDIDTNAAIVGGIVALSSKPPGIPREWIGSRETLRTFFAPRLAGQDADEPR